MNKVDKFLKNGLTKCYNKSLQMRKTKQQLYFKPTVFKHEDLTPKTLPKSPVNYRQRKLPCQSSAVPTNRIKQRDPNIFRTQKPTSSFDSPVKIKLIPTEQQVFNSSAYRQLEEEILAMITRQQASLQKLNEIKQSKQREIKQTKNEQHSIKLDIWQVRNETMNLKEAIQNQQDQYEKLLDELGITEEQFENHMRHLDGQSQNEEFFNYSQTEDPHEIE